MSASPTEETQRATEAQEATDSNTAMETEANTMQEEAQQEAGEHTAGDEDTEMGQPEDVKAQEEPGEGGTEVRETIEQGVEDLAMIKDKQIMVLLQKNNLSPEDFEEENIENTMQICLQIKDAEKRREVIEEIARFFDLAVESQNIKLKFVLDALKTCMPSSAWKAKWNKRWGEANAVYRHRNKKEEALRTVYKHWTQLPLEIKNWLATLTQSTLLTLSKVTKVASWERGIEAINFCMVERLESMLSKKGAGGSRVRAVVTNDMLKAIEYLGTANWTPPNIEARYQTLNLVYSVAGFLQGVELLKTLPGKPAEEPTTEEPPEPQTPGSSPAPTEMETPRVAAAGFFGSFTTPTAKTGDLSLRQSPRKRAAESEEADSSPTKKSKMDTVRTPLLNRLDPQLFDDSRPQGGDDIDEEFYDASSLLFPDLPGQAAATTAQTGITPAVPVTSAAPTPSAVPVPSGAPAARIDRDLPSLLAALAASAVLKGPAALDQSAHPELDIIDWDLPLPKIIARVSINGDSYTDQDVPDDLYPRIRDLSHIHMHQKILGGLYSTRYVEVYVVKQRRPSKRLRILNVPEFNLRKNEVRNRIRMELKKEEKERLNAELVANFKNIDGCQCKNVPILILIDIQEEAGVPGRSGQHLMQKLWALRKKKKMYICRAHAYRMPMFNWAAEVYNRQYKTEGPEDYEPDELPASSEAEEEDTGSEVHTSEAEDAEEDDEGSDFEAAPKKKAAPKKPVASNRNSALPAEHVDLEEDEIDISSLEKILEEDGDDEDDEIYKAFEQSEREREEMLGDLEQREPTGNMGERM